VEEDNAGKKKRKSLARGNMQRGEEKGGWERGGGKMWWVGAVLMTEEGGGRKGPRPRRTMAALGPGAADLNPSVHFINRH